MLEFAGRDRFPSGPDNLYRFSQRDHEAEALAAHSEGKECNQCHVGSQAWIGVDLERTGVFWHALHTVGLLGRDEVAAVADRGRLAAASARDCESCHRGIESESATRFPVANQSSAGL